MSESSGGFTPAWSQARRRRLWQSWYHYWAIEGYNRKNRWCAYTSADGRSTSFCFISIYSQDIFQKVQTVVVSACQRTFCKWQTSTVYSCWTRYIEHCTKGNGAETCFHPYHCVVKIVDPCRNQRRRPQTRLNLVWYYILADISLSGKLFSYYVWHALIIKVLIINVL